MFPLLSSQIVAVRSLPSNYNVLELDCAFDSFDRGPHPPGTPSLTHDTSLKPAVVGSIGGLRFGLQASQAMTEVG